MEEKGIFIKIFEYYEDMVINCHVQEKGWSFLRYVYN